MGSTLARAEERSTNWKTSAEAIASRARRPFLFGVISAFSILYYYRPEDFIRPLNYIPMAKITGGIGFLALIFAMLGSGKLRTPRAVKILWLLFLQMAACIPFALWPGGAFSTVFEKFFKAVVAAMLISMAAVTVRELRKLLWIQLSAVALVTLVSILLHHNGPDGRLTGISLGILENPNDLAINIAISFPLGVAFLLNARGFKKAIWYVLLAFMALGVVMTYSRSGLLAFIISVIVCVWEYGIKGKRHNIVAMAVLTFLLGLGVIMANPRYRARVESIVLGNIEGSGDQGSLAARKALLKKSVMVSLTHPLFGVGPGCFALVDQGWVVAHNTYTEISAEAGIPALVLFLMVIRAAFKNISQVRKSRAYAEDTEVRLLTQALSAGLVAYLFGACFASTEYNLFLYFMVGYTCAMVRIVPQPLADYEPGRKVESWRRASYDGIRRSPVRSR